MLRTILLLFAAQSLALCLWLGLLRRDAAESLPPAGVVFFSDYQIYQVSWFGNGLQKLSQSEMAWSPVLSPEGHILFSGMEDGRFFIYEVRDSLPFVLGETIVHKKLLSTPQGLFLADHDGGVYRWEEQAAIPLVVDSAVFDPIYHKGALYFTNRTEALHMNIFRFWLASGELENLTPHASDNVDPQVSPDGDWLFFISLRTGDQDIFGMRMDGSETINLSQNIEIDYSPRVFPNGDYLLFAGYRQGNADIYRVRLADGQVKNLTPHPAQDESPSISPDGQWISFSSSRGGIFSLHRMDIDGGQVLDLAPSLTVYGGQVVFLPPRQLKGALWRVGALVCFYMGIRMRKVLPSLGMLST